MKRRLYARVMKLPAGGVFTREIADDAPLANFNPWRIMAPAAIVSGSQFLEWYFC